MLWCNICCYGCYVHGYQGMQVAAKEAESKELMAKLHHERMDTTFQRDILHYLIQDKVDVEIDDSIIGTHDGMTRPHIKGLQGGLPKNLKI